MQVKSALALIDALKRGDYYSFFNVVRTLPYLESCLAFRLFPVVRGHAVQAMRKAKMQLTIEEFTE